MNEDVNPENFEVRGVYCSAAKHIGSPCATYQVLVGLARTMLTL